MHYQVCDSQWLAHLSTLPHGVFVLRLPSEDITKCLPSTAFYCVHCSSPLRERDGERKEGKDRRWENQMQLSLVFPGELKSGSQPLPWGNVAPPLAWARFPCHQWQQCWDCYNSLWDKSTNCLSPGPKAALNFWNAYISNSQVNILSTPPILSICS